MCILGFSKVLMYELHFYYFKHKYGNNLRLLFTDTDNLMYEIKTEDVYEDFSKDQEIFDFSNYSVKSKYYDDSNKLVVGNMKKGRGGAAVKEFVGLPNMCSCLVDASSEHK